MIDEIDLFNFLLPLEDVTSLYFNIGFAVCTDIDMTAYSYNNKALKNTLDLLMNLGFISKIDDTYQKEFVVERNQFQSDLKESLFSKYGMYILTILVGKIQYDSENKEIFIKRNSISLKASGLFMLLNDFKEVRFLDNRVLCAGEKIQNLIFQKDKTRKVSLEELEKRILREKELGEQAEKFALAYEKFKLNEAMINIEPVQISLIDASAGFDILSHFSNNSDDEKYIEVKSCDRRYTFHISENEINKAKMNRERYYLYLFNRCENIIKEIQDPYRFFFEDNDGCWVVEADGYKIHEI